MSICGKNLVYVTYIKIYVILALILFFPELVLSTDQNAGKIYICILVQHFD